MSPPDAVKHTHIHAIDLAVSNKTELAIAVRTLEQHTAGRFAIVKARCLFRSATPLLVL